MFFRKKRERLHGAPDGTYVFVDADGNEHQGCMPPDVLHDILQRAGARRLTPVIIREPDDKIREDLWPIDEDSVQRLGDPDGIVHVVSQLEDGRPQYNFVSKRIWDNYDVLLEIMMDPSLSEADRELQMQSAMERTAATASVAPQRTEPLAHKSLIEKAGDAPISLRILCDTLKHALESELPHITQCRGWCEFVMAATVGGCISLAIRLHWEVPEDRRTELELRLREVLGQRFPESWKAYVDCYHFVTERLADMPRPERGKYLFSLIAMWVVGVVTDNEQIPDQEYVMARIAEVYQNETAGFWDDR